jgi:hypothetical protein
MKAANESDFKKRLHSWLHTTEPTQPNHHGLHTQREIILLITRPSLEARSPVAPNVAGSNPVSHPNFQKFQLPFKSRPPA